MAASRQFKAASFILLFCLCQRWCLIFSFFADWHSLTVRACLLRHMSLIFLIIFLCLMWHISFHPTLNTCCSFCKGIKAIGEYAGADAEPNDNVITNDRLCHIISANFTHSDPLNTPRLHAILTDIVPVKCLGSQNRPSLRLCHIGWSLTVNWWNKGLCQAGNET